MKETQQECTTMALLLGNEGLLVATQAGGTGRGPLLPVCFAIKIHPSIWFLGGLSVIYYAIITYKIT
jgi:hypothetical protein